MSQKIWLELQKSLADVRPDLAAEFALCKTKETITAFLNEKMPIEKKNKDDPDEKTPDWNDQLMTKAPDLIRNKKIYKPVEPPIIPSGTIIMPDDPVEDI